MVFKRLFRAAKRTFPWKNSTRFSTVVKVGYETGYCGQYLGIAKDVNPANCYYFQKPPHFRYKCLSKQDPTFNNIPGIQRLNPWYGADMSPAFRTRYYGPHGCGPDIVAAQELTVQ